MWYNNYLVRLRKKGKACRKKGRVWLWTTWLLINEAHGLSLIGCATRLLPSQLSSTIRKHAHVSCQGNLDANQRINIVPRSNRKLSLKLRELWILSCSTIGSLFFSRLSILRHILYLLCSIKWDIENMWNNSVSFPRLLPGSHSWKHVFRHYIFLLMEPRFTNECFVDQPFFRCVIFVWAMLPAVSIMQVLTGFLK